MNDDRKKSEAQFLPFRYFYIKLGRKIVRHIFPWDLTNCNKKSALSHLDTTRNKGLRPFLLDCGYVLPPSKGLVHTLSIGT